ncbi:MAG: molybdopterin synthase [Halobacteriota archaeon]|uniref:molybdopterin synthase n=1 Tax=Natronomonas sp. TaxID=2184060 RepID=UPI003975CE0F
MYTVSLLGSDAEPAASRLAAAVDGRVGIVRADPSRTDGSRTLARSTTEYVVDDEWHASGDGLSAGDAVDRLAPDHDYAFVLGVPDARFPALVVGDEDASDPLVSAASVDDLDTDAAIEAIHGTESYETLESLVAAVKRSDAAAYSGAIATFTGRVRAKENADDDRTHYLEFEKYEGVAETKMDTIETELEERDGVLDVRLHHRTGRVLGGEDIVFVVVLAGHRGEAFDAVRDGINRLKDEVPLFKKEVTDAEEFWVHDRE